MTFTRNASFETSRSNELQIEGACLCLSICEKEGVWCDIRTVHVGSPALSVRLKVAQERNQTYRLINEEVFIVYTPKPYAAQNPRSIIEGFPFATVTTAAPGLLATATPLYFVGDPKTSSAMAGHFAAGNPQAKAVVDGMDVLAIFNGPHAYISAHWYEDRPTVPTWDYVAAHVRGKIKVLPDTEAKLAVLELVSARAEAYQGKPWTLADAPEGKVDSLIDFITAFHIEIEDIVGVTKLNQTHPRPDQLRVADQLERRNYFGDAEIARAIRNLAIDAE